jgi:phosphoribosylanthranilate isomerase
MAFNKSLVIKVCGMRDEENIHAVEQLDVDWMGFVFYPESPRYMAQPLGFKNFPFDVKRVGVFVNEQKDIVRKTSLKNLIQVIQLHGSELPSYCRVLQLDGFEVMKAFSIDSERRFPVKKVRLYEKCCDYFLFDTRTSGYGGSGRKFDWDMLSDYRGDVPFLLSGGISPDDVEAIKAFSHPMFMGIDLNSCFEISPGYKDTALLQSFIEEIRK